jgi:hypothetical protein
LATSAVAVTAVESAKSMVAGRPDGTELVRQFEVAIEALGTPRFREVLAAALEGAEPLKGQAYASAYVDGVQAVLAASGVVGIVGAVIAWFLMGRRDPLRTVFDMQDERERGLLPEDG